MILAWLLLLTGLTISAVAIYYSVVGLTAIFAAAAVPIILMGTTLEVAKLVCASWLKANWERVPTLMKTYMTIAVVVLMAITSMGIFGFLSKAHLDQSLVSGDVQSKIAIIDEKIKTEKDNIESAKKALAQMDAAVDQTMARSTNEAGANRAAQLRRSQAKERATLQADITKAQKNIVTLNDEAAPIRAEVRKVEAEVGPIKYIAAFVYGDNPDANILEKAVTWVIIVIVVVFDPLAVIMLLAAQMTFGWTRKQDPAYEQDEGPLSEDQIDQIKERVEPVVSNTTPVVDNTTELEQWNKMIEAAENAVKEEQVVEPPKPILLSDLVKQKKLGRAPSEEAVQAELTKGEELLQAEEASSVERPGDYLTEEDSKKKSYMTKDEQGHIQIKNRT